MDCQSREQRAGGFASLDGLPKPRAPGRRICKSQWTALPRPGTPERSLDESQRFATVQSCRSRFVAKPKVAPKDIKPNKPGPAGLCNIRGPTELRCFGAGQPTELHCFRTAQPTELHCCGASRADGRHLQMASRRIRGPGSETTAWAQPPWPPALQLLEIAARRLESVRLQRFLCR